MTRYVSTLLSTFSRFNLLTYSASATKPGFIATTPPYMVTPSRLIFDLPIKGACFPLLEAQILKGRYAFCEQPPV
jgi:hypothetical protein